MRIREVRKILQDINMQNKECNFKLIGSGRITTSDVLKIMDKRFDALIKEMHAGFAQINLKIDKLDKNINSRIDNLVKMNNLKE